MKDVANRIIERINREVGNDVKNLHKCKSIVDDYTKRVGEIEAEVCHYSNNEFQIFSISIKYK